MQIHEINPLREGLLDRVKDMAKDVAVAAVSPVASDKWTDKMGQQTAINRLGRLQAQGHGQQAAPQAGATINKVKSNPQMQQYAKTLAQQWMQQAQALSITPTTAKSAQPRPSAAAQAPAAAPAVPGAVPQTPATAPAAAPAVSVGGQKLNPKNPQDARVLAALKSQGKLGEAFANLPGGSQAVPAPQQYLAKFREWAAKTLVTRDPTTYQNITLDMIEKDPVIGRQLDQAQGKVVASRDNPTNLESALEEYILTALAGVQQVVAANKARSTPTVSPTSTTSSGNTGQQLSQNLASMGINTNQVRATGRMLQQQSGGNRVIRATGDAAVDEYLRQMGYRVS